MRADFHITKMNSIIIKPERLLNSSTSADEQSLSSPPSTPGPDGSDAATCHENSAIDHHQFTQGHCSVVLVVCMVHLRPSQLSFHFTGVFLTVTVSQTSGLSRHLYNRLLYHPQAVSVSCKNHCQHHLYYHQHHHRLLQSQFRQFFRENAAVCAHQ
jgi:hypothetical protein